MTQFITRAYNSFTTNFNNSTIRKHSKEDRLKQEAEYYKKVPKALSIYFPRLVESGYNKETEEYFLELELYPYENLGKYLVEGTLTAPQWREIAKHLAEILKEFSEVKMKQPFEQDLRAMYVDKTETEYKRLVEGFKTFAELEKFPDIKLNGKTYKNFSNIWPTIKDRYLSKLLDPDKRPTVVHGDFCFSNILLGFLKSGEPILRFVDPRGTFGTLEVYGDPYYDLAKLMHSTDVGYEYIIYDRFNLEKIGEATFGLSYHNDHKLAVNEIFSAELYSKSDEKLIKLIEATIYIGMCARHYDSERRQLAMYLSGVRLLNELL